LPPIPPAPSTLPDAPAQKSDKLIIKVPDGRRITLQRPKLPEQVLLPFIVAGYPIQENKEPNQLALGMAIQLAMTAATRLLYVAAIDDVPVPLITSYESMRNLATQLGSEALDHVNIAVDNYLSKTVSKDDLVILKN
jgi:hypothetical protein